MAFITTAPAEGEEAEVSLGDDYIGQDFAINAAWSPVGLQPKELLTWLLFRELDGLPDSNKVILWLRLGGQ